jgi:hypothetical protein
VSERVSEWVSEWDHHYFRTLTVLPLSSRHSQWRTKTETDGHSHSLTHSLTHSRDVLSGGCSAVYAELPACQRPAVLCRSVPVLQSRWEWVSEWVREWEGHHSALHCVHTVMSHSLSLTHTHTHTLTHSVLPCTSLYCTVFSHSLPHYITHSLPHCHSLTIILTHHCSVSPRPLWCVCMYNSI